MLTAHSVRALSLLFNKIHALTPGAGIPPSAFPLKRLPVIAHWRLGSGISCGAASSVGVSPPMPELLQYPPADQEPSGTYGVGSVRG